MLERMEYVWPLLRCPTSGQPLRREADSLVVTEPDTGRTYAVIDGRPVLVNFDRSVLDERATIASAGGSVIERANPESALRRTLKRLISPPNQVTNRNVHRMIGELHRSGERPQVLFVGGGTVGHGMQPFYDDARIRVISFDIYASERVQVIADAHQIPFADESVDGVVVQAVLEHVLEPTQVVEEIHRVLKPGGLVYAETPFLQQVHEGAYDFTRFTESGHRYLFKKYEALDSGATKGVGDQALRTIDYLFRGLFRSRLVGKIVKLACFWIQYVDRFIPEEYAVDAASGVYFLGRKSDHTMTPKETIAHYRGAQRAA